MFYPQLAIVILCTLRSDQHGILPNLFCSQANTLHAEGPRVLGGGGATNVRENSPLSKIQNPCNKPRLSVSVSSQFGSLKFHTVLNTHDFDPQHSGVAALHRKKVWFLWAAGDDWEGKEIGDGASLPPDHPDILIRCWTHEFRALCRLARC